MSGCVTTRVTVALRRGSRTDAAEHLVIQLVDPAEQLAKDPELAEQYGFTSNGDGAEQGAATAQS